VYTVTLEHSDTENRSILLETFFEAGQQRARAEYLSKELQLPFLEETADGEIISHKPEELEENIRQQIHEGKIKRSYASDVVYPAKRYKLIQTPEGFIFKRGYTPYLFVAAALFAAGYYVRFHLSPQDPKGKMSDFGLVLAVFSAFAALIGTSKEIITVTRESVTYQMFLGGFFNFRYVMIPSNSIQEIIIASDRSMGGIDALNRAVKVSSDTKVFYFGHYAGNEQREWMADKLIDFVSKINS
jgi:hypothetical protein